MPGAETMRDHKLQFLLRLADNALVLGQRLTEWVGKGPALEEDMALANTALDLIGQARLWFTYAGELEGKGRTEDDFAYLRDAHQFRNALLVEQPNGDYADTLVRQYLFDSWHLLMLDALAGSSDERIAGIADKARKEVTYHLRRSAGLMIRLGDGTAESRRRMQRALDDLWMYTGELFSTDEVDAAMQACGVVGELAGLREAWIAQLRETLAAATLALPPEGAWMQRGGKQGRHSEHMGFLLAEMQFMQRAYPGLQW